MTALLIDDPADTTVATALRRRALTAGHEDSRDEKWLQKLLFDHPQLVPLDEIDLNAGAMLPLTRELPLPRGGGSVFPDLLGVTRAGRLVIVECKLWRNPQARREVIAQITEYAALLRRWSYTDLGERLKQKERWPGSNPLFDRARARWPDLDEARFVDGVTRSLATGDFHLLIVGDGIRSDLLAIVDHMAGTGAGLARLGLVEIQLWSDAAGRIVVLPRAAARTEVLTHRVLISGEGRPVMIEPEAVANAGADETNERPTVIAPERAAKMAANRAFWQRFIDEVRFEHAEQPAPRHGGDNSVRMTMPADAPWITGYRTDAEVGLFLRLKGETGRLVFSQIEAEGPALRSECGLDVVFQMKAEEPFESFITVVRKRSDLGDDAAQLVWLNIAADRFVSAMRPRLKALYALDD